MFNNVFKDKNVLITGHTGFKGSWLCLWLKSLGANVRGVSNEEFKFSSHWSELHLEIAEDIFDITDFKRLDKVIKAFKPDIIFHLAAQSLVKRSYLNPYDTFITNVIGTLNILESVRTTNSDISCLIVTSDKCYENKEWLWGYRETEPLGGNDAYSASKAMCELLTHSYRKSFFSSVGRISSNVATARAGNVIGGGDWSEDRIVPDIARAALNKSTLEIRNPDATRPWQHVLDCLQGYLLLGAELLVDNKHVSGAWNFGPDQTSSLPVKDLVSALNEHGLKFKTTQVLERNASEANNLFLDSAKARKYLKWKPVWGFSSAVDKTASWYKQFIDQGVVVSNEQLQHYFDEASSTGCEFLR